MASTTIINLVDTSTDNLNTNARTDSGELLSKGFNETIVAPFVILYGERVIVACIYLVIFIFGIVGNSMVIIAVFLSRKLRSPTNYLITNLAVSDLLTCVMLIWNVVALLSRTGWPIGDWLCQVAGTIIYTSSGTSLYNLAAIAINRLIKITKLQYFNKIYTYRNVRFMIAITWLVPLPLIIIPPLFDIGEIGYDPNDYTCSDLELHPKSSIFNYYQSAVIPIPLVTIIVCYASILIHIRRHFKIQKLRQSLQGSLQRKPSTYKSSENGLKQPVVGNGTVINETSVKLTFPSTIENVQLTTPPGSPWHAKDNKIDNQQLEITMNLFYVVLAFLICSIPYFLALLLASVMNTDHFMLYAGAILLASSAINPGIYAWKHPIFKVVLKAMLLCRYRDIPQPSVAVKHVIIKNSLELPSSSFHSRTNSKSLPSRPGSKNVKREAKEPT